MNPGSTGIRIATAVVNRSAVGIGGFQYSVNASFAKGISAGGGLTSLSFHLPDTAAPLRNRPRLKANGFFRAAIDASTSFHAGLDYAGRTFDSSVPTGPVYLPSYSVLNVAVAHSQRGREFRVALDNAFDRHYQQFVGFPSPGRRLRLQFAIDL